VGSAALTAPTPHPADRSDTRCPRVGKSDGAPPSTSLFAIAASPIAGDHAIQRGALELLGHALTNDGKATHIDHEVTVKVFADKVFTGELTFDDAYRQLWDGSNLRATHRGCNYARKNEPPAIGETPT
jgi:hypothetical protein